MTPPAAPPALQEVAQEHLSWMAELEVPSPVCMAVARPRLFGTTPPKRPPAPGKRGRSGGGQARPANAGAPAADPPPRRPKQGGRTGAAKTPPRGKRAQKARPAHQPPRRTHSHKRMCNFPLFSLHLFFFLSAMMPLQTLMQTTLSAFIGPNQKKAALPTKSEREASRGTVKRQRDEEYAESYPIDSRAAKILTSQLHHLRPHICRGLFAHSKYGPSLNSRNAFALGKTPVVRTVVSTIHPTRSSNDGELLVSPLDTFRNCILSTVWDPRDEYLIAAKRSGFQLFGASSWLEAGTVSSEVSKPVLELKSATVQARLGRENRISFGLLVAQFLGSSLNTICGYSGAPQLDIFDLEDLDEATGEPLRTYNLCALRFDSSSGLVSSVSATNAVVSVSDTVAIAALSNGCSALVDIRASTPLLCTEASPPPAILRACNPGTRRVLQGTAMTAVALAHRSDCTQLLTGTKDGILVLWDLRMRNKPVAISSVGGEVEALHVIDPSLSCRCGAPTVWLNTDLGDIACFSIGESSFEEVTRLSTSDSRRTQLSANLSPPKLSVISGLDCLIYPHVSSNSLLFYDIGHFISSTESQSSVGVSKCSFTGTQKSKRASFMSDFMERTLLPGHEKDQECACLLSDSKKGTWFPSLFASYPFFYWSHQICSVSASSKHRTICVGGDDGDLHVLSDFPS
ncbi:hypothetical protein, conserved [Leishmania tarentolae]|uniref:Guanine nucleotide-binding protein subunit beta-like protein n=1 Tax=Leishmania tarentolae TaxID=5689 RepID=A0A640KVF8_LEITA|nr:hypothetical protein, conserved [Leishmania tarentolae]